MAFFRDLASLLKLGIVASNSAAALGAYLAASGQVSARPSFRGGLLVLGGTALVVAGACAINNWLDRDLDARMERTKERPTARGAIKGPVAMSLGLGLSLGGEVLLARLGLSPCLLGLAGWLLYLGAYTLWAKRRGSWSSLVGGLAGALPPLIGWAAADPRLGGGAVVLFGLLVLWQQVHVRALAQMRASEYQEAGLPLPGLGKGEKGDRATVRIWLAVLAAYSVLAVWSLGRTTWILASAWACLCLLESFLPKTSPRTLFRLTLGWLCLVLASLAASGLWPHS